MRLISHRIREAETSIKSERNKTVFLELKLAIKSGRRDFFGYFRKMGVVHLPAGAEQLPVLAVVLFLLMYSL